MTSGTPAPVVPVVPYEVVQGTRASRATAIAGLFLLTVMATLPFWGSGGTMRLLVEFLTLLALAQMWNLLAGYAGLVSIGQQAFVGLGAYGLFLFADLARLPAIPAVLLTAVVVAVIGLGTSVLAFRLEGGYFAIGTWVIAEVFRLLVANTRELGAGTGVTVQSLISMPSGERQALTYWLALGVGFGSTAAVALIMRSRIGLALRAVRDSEIAARSLGVDVFRAKLLIFVIAAVGCSLAASVIYMQLLRIQPNAAFGIDWTAKMIFIVIIGGIGRIEGPIVGTIAFFLLQETLADFGGLYLVILGIVAITITLLAPHGLWGLWASRFPMAPFGIQRRLVVADDAART